MIFQLIRNTSSLVEVATERALVCFDLKLYHILLSYHRLGECDNPKGGFRGRPVQSVPNNPL